MSTFLRVTSDLAAEAPVGYDKFGIAGDGKTFDQNGVLNLISALDEGGIVHLAGAPVMLLGDTVALPPMKNRKLTSDRAPGPDGLNVPRFQWDGAKGGVMFAVDRCEELWLEGFVVESGSRTPGERADAGIIFDCDGGFDTKGPGPYGSSCTFRWIRHISNHPHEVIVFAIARTTGWNQEYHDITECAGNGNGAGTFVYQGPQAANAVQTRVRLNRQITGYGKALWFRNGSFHLDTNNLSGNAWNLYHESASAVCTEHATTSEYSKHHAYYGASIESFGNKFDPQHTSVGDAYIWFGQGAKRVTLRSSGLDGGLPKGARALGWENDGSNRHVDVELLFDDGIYERADLGIDYPCLSGSGHAEKQAGAVTFRTRPGAIRDLPSGELRYNVPSPSIELNAPAPVACSSMQSIAKGPVDWKVLTPGMSIDYVDPSENYVMRQLCLPDGTHATAIVGKLAKVK